MEYMVIVVQTIVDVPIKHVWTYWNEPKHIMKWYSASDDWHTPFATNDLKVIGKFNYRMEAKDGSFGFDFSGMYLDIKPYESITYELDDHRKVNIEFNRKNDMTEIIQKFEAEPSESLELQETGWQSILDHFKTYAQSTYHKKDM